MRQTSFSRRALAVVGLTAAAALTLSGCASTDSGSEASADSVTVGISQFVQHPALDAATAGFKEAFKEAGYVEGETVVFDEQNAQAEVPTAGTIAESFAGNKDIDLVLAVATPSAQAAVNSITEVPVLFTAVTDGVEAQLVASNEAPGANVTGTSDAVPEEALEQQFQLLKEIKPDAKTVGIVYASGEVNSEVQVKNATAVAKKHGLEIKTSTVTTGADISSAAEALGKVDAFYVPTDNVVVAGIASLVKVAETNKIPVIAAEAGTVEGGALATVGIDYFALGKQTGAMAVKILKGEAEPATMPVEFADTLASTYNSAAAKAIGIELPESITAEGTDVSK